MNWAPLSQIHTHAPGIHVCMYVCMYMHTYIILVYEYANDDIICVRYAA